MSEQLQRWGLGQARITSVVEDQTDGIPPEFFFPEATAAEILRHADWLQPHYASDTGAIGLRVQAFVIEIAGRTIVVDPCVGNGRTRSLPFWNQQEWPFMERFAAAGFHPDQVDLVVHTHLHTDHVGWGTRREDDRWVPTFTRARYLYIQPELEWFRSGLGDAEVAAIHDDSIAPVFEAGLADLVEGDADLGNGLRFEPTVGHTPGHSSLWIESAGERALVTGDAIHHPVQCAEPSLAFVSDDDPELARTTRHKLLQQAAEPDVLTLGTHFPTRPAGRVVAAGSAWRFLPS